jgi:hypothetical protein
MSESRRIVMIHAMEVLLGIRADDPGLLFTDDVVVWSPNLLATSLDELRDAATDRNDALGNLAVAITGVDVVDNKAFAEWVVSADHIGPLVLNDIRVEATGRRIELGGASVAEFDGTRIAALRTYFDAAAVLEQMLE